MVGSTCSRTVYCGSPLDDFPQWYEAGEFVDEVVMGLLEDEWRAAQEPAQVLR